METQVQETKASGKSPRWLKIAGGVIVVWLILVTARMVFSKIDYDRVNAGGKPMFCYEAGRMLDGGTSMYQGIGYEITRLRRNTSTGRQVGPILRYELNWLLLPLEDKSNIRHVT